MAAVKAIEANYLQAVKMSKKLALLKKEELIEEEENTKDNEAIGHM